jgi:hypothetical protein
MEEVHEIGVAETQTPFFDELPELRQRGISTIEGLFQLPDAYRRGNVVRGSDFTLDTTVTRIAYSKGQTNLEFTVRGVYGVSPAGEGTRVEYVVEGADRPAASLPSQRRNSDADRGGFIVDWPQSVWEEEAIKFSIYHIKFPEEWATEGVNAPTDVAKSRALAIAFLLFKRHALFPARIAPSADDGIALVYRDGQSKKELFIEAYNDGEACALVMTRDKIELSRQIDESPDSVLSDLVQAYRR